MRQPPKSFQKRSEKGKYTHSFRIWKSAQSHRFPREKSFSYHHRAWEIYVSLQMKYKKCWNANAKTINIKKIHAEAGVHVAFICYRFDALCKFTWRIASVNLVQASKRINPLTSTSCNRLTLRVEVFNYFRNDLSTIPPAMFVEVSI